MANDSEIGLYDLPREISDFAESEGIVPSSAATKTPPANILAKFADAPLVQFWDSEFLSDMTIPLQTKVETVTDQLEREVILRALEQCQQHRQATADLLGISRKSLHNKMTKLGLFSERPDSTESDPGL
jgi:DNA-binding NtrC family response regulator